ncbi:MAG: hypothetical protein R6X10_01325 [Desulfobacterales bacterium]
MKNRKKLSIITFLAVSIFSISAVSFAESPITVEGEFQGANCIFFLKKCPANMPDAHIATEPDFVLVKNSNTYYYVTNLDRAIKAKYIHKPARVIGKKRNQSIVAESLEIKIDDKFKQVWNLKDEKAEKEKAAVDW